MEQTLSHAWGRSWGVREQPNHPTHQSLSSFSNAQIENLGVAKPKSQKSKADDVAIANMVERQQEWVKRREAKMHSLRLMLDAEMKGKAHEINHMKSADFQLQTAYQRSQPIRILHNGAQHSHSKSQKVDKSSNTENTVNTEKTGEIENSNHNLQQKCDNHPQMSHCIPKVRKTQTPRKQESPTPSCTNSLRDTMNQEICRSRAWEKAIADSQQQLLGSLPSPFRKRVEREIDKSTPLRESFGISTNTKAQTLHLSRSPKQTIHSIKQTRGFKGEKVKKDEKDKKTEKDEKDEKDDLQVCKNSSQSNSSDQEHAQDREVESKIKNSCIIVSSLDKHIQRQRKARMIKQVVFRNYYLYAYKVEHIIGLRLYIYILKMGV